MACSSNFSLLIVMSPGLCPAVYQHGNMPDHHGYPANFSKARARSGARSSCCRCTGVYNDQFSEKSFHNNAQFRNPYQDDPDTDGRNGTDAGDP